MSYEDKDKVFSEMHVGYMKDDEYTSRFLYFLRYVPYIKDEHTKIERFISGLVAVYRDQIDFDYT